MAYLRRRNSIPTKDKQLLFNCFQQNGNWQNLAELMNIKVNSARSIIVRAQGSNGEVALGRGGAEYRKVDAQMKQFLSNGIDRNCVITRVIPFSKLKTLG